MTYNVFGGTLNPAQLHQSTSMLLICQTLQTLGGAFDGGIASLVLVNRIT